MASSRELELQIGQVEQLKVRLLNENGRQVRADCAGFAEYPYQRAANGNLTVAAWKQARFCKHYEGYEIEVLGDDGEPVHGRTILANVKVAFPGVFQAELPEGQESELESNEPAVPSEILNPELIFKRGGPFPSVEVNVDNLPYVGAFEDAIYSATKIWVRNENLSTPATIWSWGTQTCNFIGHGSVRSVFVVPFGFAPNYLEFLYRHLSEKLPSAVRRGEYLSPNRNDGWNGVCHVQDGKVYQVGDEVTWFEV